MVIPTRYIFSGDVEKAKALIGEGRRRLLQLEHFLSFRKISTASPPADVFADGTTIRCVINYGLKEVYINVPGVDESSTLYCLCFPNFSMGIIVDEDPVSPSPAQLATGVRFKYGVDLCIGRKYFYFPGVPSNGWAKYYVGQRVLVAATKPSNNLNPCDRDCLGEEPLFTHMLIVAAHVTPMSKWKFD